MVELSLLCTIVGEAGSAFGLKIDDAAQVWDLKKAIKAKNLDDPTLKNVDPKNLQLSLAKTKAGLWLLENDIDAQELENGAIPPEVTRMIAKNKMMASWSVKEVLDEFKMTLELAPTSKQLHVLVTVPGYAGVGVASVEPSAAPTTIHRHPNRLKRWAAINEKVRQKNRNGNEKTSNQETNKKRKNRDLDSSVPYSSFSWDEIQLILSLEGFDLKAEPVPDEVVEQTLARLAQVHKLYGDVYTGKEATRKMFILAVLEAACLLVDDVKILCEEDVNGRNVRVNGKFEFVLKRGSKRISIVEAKRDSIEQGMAQNITGLEALADVEGLERTLGIVTTYLNWVFICDDEVIQCVDQTLDVRFSMPTKESLKNILGMIHGMLETGAALAEGSTASERLDCVDRYIFDPTNLN